MTVMNQLRTYHAFLALFVCAAFFGTEWGHFHIWLGYAVVLILLIRLAMVFSGARQLGLMRFYPHFDGLKLNNVFTHPAISRTLLLAIAASLITVVVSGLAMDRGRAFTNLIDPDQKTTSVVATPVSDRDDNDEREQGKGENEEGGWLSEVHEVSGNLLMLIVVVHVTYLFAFKRPIARFMLFSEGSKPPK